MDAAPHSTSQLPQHNPQAFSGAMDQSAVIVRNWDGVIQHWTAGCEHLYGWKAREAVGKICQELLQTKFTVPLAEIQQQLATSGSWKGELEHTRADGVVLAISAFWVAMHDENEEVQLVVETQTDVTSHARMRQEMEAAHEKLKQIRDDLERSNEELEEFARIASHDLSAPLTSTRWLLDTFVERYAVQLNLEAQNCLDQIGRSLARMSDLIEGVLSHARAGRNAARTNICSDSREALLIALDNLQNEVSQSAATISYGSLPEVTLSPQSLAQLFQNLLSNALKYSRPSIAPSIVVSATRQDQMWLFAVTDNGVGIEAEWFDRVFQPMQRHAGMAVSGSGIGLATCRKIVRRAGGQIWVESEIGSGSTFLFTLPAGDSPAAS